MKKRILCGQLYATTCGVVFTGRDPEEILKLVWQHLSIDDEHSGIRHRFKAMGERQISEWQERFSRVWKNAPDLDAK